MDYPQKSCGLTCDVHDVPPPVCLEAADSTMGLTRVSVSQSFNPDPLVSVVCFLALYQMLKLSYIRTDPRAEHVC